MIKLIFFNLIIFFLFNFQFLHGFKKLIMISTNKNQITRQKNIEIHNFNEDSPVSQIIINEPNQNDCCLNNNNSILLNNDDEFSLNNYKLLSNCSLNSDDKKITFSNESINKLKNLEKQANKLKPGLKERFSRSKSPKPINSSPPLLEIKKSTESYSELGSFFSRSCPAQKSFDVENAKKFNLKTNSLREDAPQQSLKSLGKSFFAFATLKQSKNKKFNGSSGSFTNNSNCSSTNTELDDKNDSQVVVSKNVTKIGVFDVDLDKLAKELGQPSCNNPLTSYTLSPNSTNINNKPVLQSSKTIDEETNSNKSKTFMRSLTQNKP